MAEQHGAHQTSEAYVVSLCEDYCKSPTAPVGYMISQNLDMSTVVCSTVNGCGTPILNMSSRITRVIGNEAGIGGGVVSSVNTGMCKPCKNYAPTVRAEGKHILREGTIMEMNCAGPEGLGNVEGKIIYVNRRFNDDRSSRPTPTPEPQPNPTPTPAPQHAPEPFKKIGEHTTENGSRVPIYEDPMLGVGGGYVVDANKGPMILLGPNADAMTKANEVFHAEADSRGPGGFDGVGHTKDGREMSPLENEAGSDGASIEAADTEIKKQIERCDTATEFYTHFGCYFLQPDALLTAQKLKKSYQQRKKALEEADNLVNKGKLDEARAILKDYPVYQDKVPLGPSVR